jgi:four helix bundle protein
MGTERVNPSIDKSYRFALRIIEIYRILSSDKKEYILSKQLMRSGTSIGANVEEANGAQSKKEFRARMSIAYKECRETHYWLRLLRDSKYLSEEEVKPVLSDCDELLRIIGSIVRTSFKE